MLNSSVLVLNRSFFPVHVTNVKRAVVLLYLGIARVVDDNYQTFSFNDWRSRDADNQAKSQAIGMVGGAMALPRVIVLLDFNYIPKTQVRLSRGNIMLRDQYTCQYCGKNPGQKHLNIDHVVPRMQGGVNSWKNLVTSCIVCNRRKGGRTPEQAGMYLTRRPFQPNAIAFMQTRLARQKCQEWQPFIAIRSGSG